MGVALGWVAAALAASATGAPPQQKTGPEIAYQVRTVDVRGFGWRESGLKAVAQHNAVSVWTAPGDFLDRLPADAQALAAAPAEGKGKSRSPVHLTTRKSQDFVTRVLWKGKDRSPRPVVESVREGVTATLIGRRIDQGVLTQVVIDDVDVRSVHTIEPAGVKQARAEGKAEPKALSIEVGPQKASVTVSISATMDSEAKAEGEAPSARACEFPSKAAAIVAQCGDKAECCKAEAANTIKIPADSKPAKTDEAAARTAWNAANPGAVQIPEVGRASAAGEWLIPDGEVLVVGFGPHTVADAEGKAVVREHLAVISAEADDDEQPAASTATSREAIPAPPLPQLPETPRTAAALPELPSRSLPQGVKVDGTPAAPPVVDEEPAPAADDSAEPLATPQSRRKPAKNAIPAPKLDDAPKDEPKKSDAKAVKTSFILPALKNLQGLEPLNQLISSGTFPMPFQGAQFLVPLKPLALKLPFNQKLEFELVGRIVNDAPVESRLVLDK